MKSKIISRLQIDGLISGLKNKGQKVVFTNGCFDLLHVGHVRYLQEARALGDCLIVGLNSDQSMRQIKDPARPLIAEDQRAEVLAALTCVDHIVLFDEADPFKLIEEIRPDVLVKGADWSLDNIIGADLVSSYGGEVRRVELVPAISTSEIINRIISRYGKDFAKS
ncbi:MAG: D-glycero-beta-D-manno-heptose 1-phosphate adenylyltransferase [Deltaproteobacteria bacterium]|nr:D-glycero-beta-D-manno-heptose 1-phosphate adenylyltransferase [Deltaproteobacteria bacterium]